MDIIETWHKKGQAVVSYDPAGFFAEAVAVLRQINQFDIRQVTNGAGIYSSVSALFSVPAISFRVGRRILEYTRPFIRDDDSRALIRFRVSQNLLAMMVGDWRDVPALEPTLIEACQAQGDQWFLWVYLYFYANVLTEQGRYDETDHVLGLLKELGDFYESDLVRARRAIGEARLRLKRRQLEEANLVAIASAVPAIVEFGNPPLLIHMRSMQARLEFGRGDLAAAEEYVRAAAEILARERRVPPYYTSSYFVARLEISLHTFEASPRTQADYREAGAAVRDAIRVSRVNAIDRPEILRLAGTYAWLKGKRRQAFRLWNSSVTEGLKLGAMPEVARTREEIVRRSAIDR
jgi:hypothetical protein